MLFVNKNSIMQQKYTILFLIIYVIVVSLVGLFNSRTKDSTDYFLANRRLPAWILAITFIASWWGGGSAIDLVDQAHGAGLASFWIYGMPVLIATAIMYGFAGKIRHAAKISQPELFAQRYNATAGLLLTIFILIFMVLGAAVQVIVVGHFFQSFFDISYTSGAIIGTAIVLFYSLFGGFKGVVMTDIIQFLFFLLGGLALLVYTYYHSGGWYMMVEHSEKIGKLDYTSFWSKAPDYLAYVITFGCSWCIQANVWQRISAARSEKSARNMMLISFIAFIPLYLMVTTTGMLSSVVYKVIPEGGIVPDIVANLGSPLLSALIFVGLCSAIMSTMDSMFNTGALSLTVDIYERFKGKESLKNQVLVARLSTLLMALFALIIGLKIESVLTISWIGADFLATGAFVPLIGGFIWKKGTSKAAITSMVFGFLFSLYNLLHALGVPLPIAWQLASATQALVGMTLSFALYVGVSLFNHAYQKSLL